MMPNGNLYTSAGTLVWSSDGNKLFVAATNGTQTDILVTHINNLAVHILYTENNLMKLRENGMSYDAAEICPLENNGDDSCHIDLDLKTDKINDWRK